MLSSLLLILALLNLAGLLVVVKLLADIHTLIGHLPTKNERVEQLKRFGEAVIRTQREAREGGSAVHQRLVKRGLRGGA